MTADKVEDEKVETQKVPQLTEELIGPDFMSEGFQVATSMILNV